MAMSIDRGCPYCERPWTKEDAAARRRCERAQAEEDRAIQAEIKRRLQDALEARLQAQKEHLVERLVEPLRCQVKTLRQELEAEQHKKWKKNEEAVQRAVARREEQLEEEHAREVRRLKTTLKAMAQELERLKRRQATTNELGAEGQKRLIERIQAACPKDDCDETIRGRRGTDVFQRVRSHDRRDCGLVVWESKNDGGMSFDSKWIEQARTDLHEHRAQYIVIVANAVPKKRAAVKADAGGILVTTPDGVEALALVLHQLLVAQATKALTQGAALSILTSGRFRRDMAAVVKDIEDEQESLAKEQREHQKIWQLRRQRAQRMHERLTKLVDDTVAALERDDDRSRRQAS